MWRALASLACLVGCGETAAPVDGGPIAPLSQTLSEGWLIQSSRAVATPGEWVSNPGFQTPGWYPTTVPSTVLAALVANKVYPDPYTAMNLRAIPGTVYPPGIADGFDIPPDSPFAPAWWYRTTFQLPPAGNGERVWLRFAGINYRADVYFNGKRIADNRRIAGTFRTFELDVTDGAQAGDNAVAVAVSAPIATDLAFNWVDWSPFPPDKDMGLWGDVTLAITGPVRLRWPQAETQLHPSGAATLIIRVDAQNGSADPVKSTISAELEGTIYSKTIDLAPGETRTVELDPIELAKPRLWWPAQMGTPELYRAIVRAGVDGALSDETAFDFGVRQITSDLLDSGDPAFPHRRFLVNGKPLLIRGGGFAPDMMMRLSPSRLEDEVRYLRDMNLNAIRLEGKLGLDPLIDLCDRYGILVMPGWCCCDVFAVSHYCSRDGYTCQDGQCCGASDCNDIACWTNDDYPIAYASLTDQARRLRSHPSVFVWLNGSDSAPPDDVMKQYDQILSDQHWPNPIVESANSTTDSLHGNTGVKMSGPYTWVPPIFWTHVQTYPAHGGAFGFNTETSMGAAIPPRESLRKLFGGEPPWPIDDSWLYHSGSGGFISIDDFVDQLNNRYGQAGSLDDFLLKAQLSAYEGVRAMFEAYSRNKYVATGIIQWMLNNAWPSLIWHLYDYYLKPGGGYFGAKKALEPIHIQYGQDDRAVVAVNSSYRDASGLKAHVSLRTVDGIERFAADRSIDSLPADSSAAIMPSLPTPADLNLPDTTYLIDLTLSDSQSVLSRNLYWLSIAEDEGALDCNKCFACLGWDCCCRWNPIAYSDFTNLSQLPPTSLQWSATLAHQGEDDVVTVNLINGSALALFVRVEVAGSPDGDEAVPIRWSDNDVSLAPNESRPLTARFRDSDLAGPSPTVRLSGWNVPLSTKPLNR